MATSPSAFHLFRTGFLFLLPALSPQAGAALTLTINEFDTGRFSATLGGFFDDAAVGDQQQWLAIKANWSSNNGQNVPWISDEAGFTEYRLSDALSIVTDTVALSGLTLTQKNVAASGQRWGDAIYFSVDGPIPAGTFVSGTITIDGAGIFNPAGVQTFELVSGFDDARMDFKRLETSVPVPEPFSPMLLGLGVSAFISRRRRQ